MKERAYNPERLDLSAFVQEAAHMEGAWPQPRFQRLMADVLAPLADMPALDVAWSARGEERAVAGGAAQKWLHLNAQTQVRLVCQRCLMPMSARMAIDRHFLFARDEDHAAQLDEEVEDDVLVFTRYLDLAELVEDELILALPIVPRHQNCPQPLVHQDALADDLPQEKPNPFAALAALKKGGLPK